MSDLQTATVVGGGPGGLMAAEVLAKSGLGVTVYDHMPSMGRKFQLAGRGGLNLTHSQDLEKFLDSYGPHRAQLEKFVRAFGPDDLQAWCAELGEPTFVGTSGRVFPESFRATPLLRVWLRRLDELGVRFAVGHRWQGWSDVQGASSFEIPGGERLQVSSDVTIMSLGGASWPRVGSTGSWVAEFERQDIEVSELQPSNCGVRVNWSELIVDRFAGTPLKNVAASVGKSTVRGDVVITREGLIGGPIYAHSRAIRENLRQHGQCRLTLDLHPDLSFTALRGRFAQRRRPKDSLSTWLRRSGLDPVSRSLLREVAGSDLPNEARAMTSMVKELPLQVNSLMPLDRAISTAGGVSWSELDDSLMLRKVPGVFLAGEMLDWDAPTGGYLLQACFSTGVAAASGAIKWLGEQV